MRYVAAYLLAVLGGNKNPSVEQIADILKAGGVDSDNEKISFLLKELEGKDINEGIYYVIWVSILFNYVVFLVVVVFILSSIFIFGLIFLWCFIYLSEYCVYSIFRDFDDLYQLLRSFLLVLKSGQAKMSKIASSGPAASSAPVAAASTATASTSAAAQPAAKPTKEKTPEPSEEEGADGLMDFF